MQRNQGLVLADRGLTYMRAFRYVQEAESRLGVEQNERAEELINSAYAALQATLHEKNHSRKSALILAARMAAGLSLRELTREDGAPEAA